MNYLRDNKAALPKNRQEIKELMAEAKYYLIQGLVDLCQAALQVRQAKLAEVFCQQVQSLKLNLTISGLERPFDLSHINSRVVDQ